MRVEEIALRSEIRQMLNEAGFNRETIKQLVKESIDDVVKNQVNQVLMEKKDQDLSDVVSDYLKDSMYRQINEQVKRSTESIIKDKLRWLNFSVNVQTDRGVNK